MPTVVADACERVRNSSEHLLRRCPTRLCCICPEWCAAKVCCMPERCRTRARLCLNGQFLQEGENSGVSLSIRVSWTSDEWLANCSWDYSWRWRSIYYTLINNCGDDDNDVRIYASPFFQGRTLARLTKLLVYFCYDLLTSSSFFLSNVLSIRLHFST